MGKKIFEAIVIVAAVVCVLISVSCSQRSNNPEKPSRYAKLSVPLIHQNQNGKYDYTLPIRKTCASYPLTQLDSVKAIPHSPKTKTIFHIEKKNDRVTVTSSAPLETIMADMDSIKFVYPPTAKMRTFRQGIWWQKTDTPALSYDYYVLAFKDDTWQLYNEEGIKIDDAEEIMRTALEKPSK